MENEEMDNIITLNDEEGKEIKFEFLDLVDLDDEEYVVLLPVAEEGEEEGGEGVILKLEDTDDDFDTTEVVSRDDTDEFTDSIELTTTQIFTKDDFEDFDDLKEATKPRIFVKILIFLIVIAVIIGTVFVLDRILDLGILSRLGINF